MNIEKTSAFYPIIYSCLNAESWINVICLDHELHYKFHKVGVDITRVINANGGKTVCLQHGSTREDNIEGHKTSESMFQIVWGSYIYQSLVCDSRIEKSKIFLEGNPLHDELFSLDADATINKFERYLHDIERPLHGKKIILLATCLHSEYDSRKEPSKLYRHYIKKIYEGIDFDNYFLIVKMHPLDSIDVNIYAEQLKVKHKKNTVIFLPEDNMFSFYELLKITNLVVTRASTVAEETLMIGKSVLAFDLFKDGPSADLKLLGNFPRFKICTGKDIDLYPHITEMCEAQETGEITYQKFIYDITWKFDGKSTERVLGRLKGIAKMAQKSKVRDGKRKN